MRLSLGKICYFILTLGAILSSNAHAAKLEVVNAEDFLSALRSSTGGEKKILCQLKIILHL